MNGAAGEGMWTPRAPGDGAGANGDGDATCSATLLGDGTSMLDGDLATTCQHHTRTLATSTGDVSHKPGSRRCHYFPPGPQLPSQPLRGLLPVSLLDEQSYDGCEQFAYDCYPTASRLRFEPRPFCHARN